MIVTQTNTGWEIIQQQAHGLLAVQFALHWKEEKRPTHWVETLVALTEHDDGQDPWEGQNHLTKARTPLPFQILSYSVDQCRRLIAIGLEKSRWNALMLSMHTSFLYEEKRGTDSALDQFLDEQQGNQKQWQKLYNVTKAEVQYAYAFVQWCDALSLVLCLNQVPPESRRLEVSQGPDRNAYYISQQPDSSMRIDPWPFATAEFTVHVETSQVNQVVFRDDPELYQAIQQSPVVRKEWRFRA